ncbi:hypothetical protein R3P38DRAFT_3605217 [Favolaschia claudopus]|uniref:HNH nuclease domain-containing protein n=1 Tax=Favolaschia claudopus TaxID=2862362 RepID=A0AAW0A8I7_9AGAR
MSEDAFGHLLSEKSRVLERDTFIFLRVREKSQLFMSFNQKLTPVTSATIRRWMILLLGDRDSEEFFLCPVSLSSVGIMAYAMVACGPALDPDSSQRIPPGNYGYYRDQARKVSARDLGHCRFSGARENTVVAWIIPPSISWETVDFAEMFDWDQTEFVNIDNLLTMHQNLRSHFYKNNFTMGNDQTLLPSHLTPHPQQTTAADHYLRLHCRYTLNLMLLGGDIGEDYPNSDILKAMERLGVNHVGYGEYDPAEMAPFTDPRWETDLGKAIMANVMQQRMVMSLYESGRGYQSHEDSEADNSAS